MRSPRLLSPIRDRALVGRAMITALAIFAASATGGVKLGLNVADYVVLRRVYGPATVAREHLTIVLTKHALRVSNGDVLEGWGPTHFAIACPIFPVFAISSCAIAYLLLPT